MSDGRLALHERQAGHPLALHRSFFQWRHRTGYLVTTVEDDIANGRLPWVSIKTPSWADMAAGRHDDDLDELLGALDRVDGPVWLTMHHEPEGGGGVNGPDDPAGPAGHLAMNKRVRARMDVRGTDNIALAPVLMSWTWNPLSRRDPDQWYEPGVYDFVGVDHYTEEKASLITDTWLDVRAWAKRKGVDLAVGEWGLRGTDAVAGSYVTEWYEHAIGSATDGAGARVVGLSAFDSDLNSHTGGWTLEGGQLSAFHELLGDARTANMLDP